MVEIDSFVVIDETEEEADEEAAELFDDSISTTFGCTDIELFTFSTITLAPDVSLVSILDLDPDPDPFSKSGLVDFVDSSALIVSSISC